MMNFELKKKLKIEDILKLCYEFYKNNCLCIMKKF